MILYYNCHRPLDVLRTGCIVPSKIHRCTSLSTNFNLGSHGPFKITFRNPPWQAVLRECLYMTPIYESRGTRRLAGPLMFYQDQHGTKWTQEEYHSLMASRVAKNPMFRDEHEWVTLQPIRFQIEQVDRVMFMQNAPQVQPRIVERSRRDMPLYYRELYEEIWIHDPYLEKAV